MIHSIMPKFDEKVKQSKMDPLLNCKNMIKELHIEYEFSQSMSLIPKKKSAIKNEGALIFLELS